MISLQTKATDNFCFAYDVSLEKHAYGGRRDDWWILKINKTSGRWYLNDLLKDATNGTWTPSDQIAIDFGQGWFCTNILDLLDEAARLAGIEWRKP